MVRKTDAHIYLQRLREAVNRMSPKVRTTCTWSMMMQMTPHQLISRRNDHSFVDELDSGDTYTFSYYASSSSRHRCNKMALRTHLIHRRRIIDILPAKRFDGIITKSENYCWKRDADDEVSRIQCVARFNHRKIDITRAYRAQYAIVPVVCACL